jgi:hypothetical protein
MAPDNRLLNLLAEGEHFLSALERHEQDHVIDRLVGWQLRVEQYVLQMPEYISEPSQQKGNSLLQLVKRIEIALAQQLEWIKDQQSTHRHQHNVLQKYTQNT